MTCRNILVISALKIDNSANHKQTLECDRNLFNVHIYNIWIIQYMHSAWQIRLICRRKQDVQYNILFSIFLLETSFNKCIPQHFIKALIFNSPFKGKLNTLTSDILNFFHEIFQVLFQNHDYLVEVEFFEFLYETITISLPFLL